MSEVAPITQEIIIVRRGNGDGDGGHHGGSWKIAYADFVTAMMAFFLVMWLVNSSNEVTKARVASYFNPIKMTDASPSGRGLKDPSDKKPADKEKEKDELPKAEGEGGDKQKAEAAAEANLMENPYASLEEIVAKEATISGGGVRDIANHSVGDPFDPKAWEALKNAKPKDAIKNTGEGEKAKEPVSKVSTDLKGDDADAHIEANEPKLRPTKDITDEKDKKFSTDRETVVLEESLKKIVDKYKSDLDVSVSVRRTDEGLLIMLGDNSGKGMFGIGSAKPNAGLIEIVSVMGKLLSQQQGDVVIRGHTDSRQYKTSRYDNWQLSTARAHMASYMLIRGGLVESRIKRIEGHGSATPLLIDDALADANRRVEVLLTTENSKQ